MREDYRPRFPIDITDEQDAKLKELLPWGSRGPLFRAIIDELLPIIEKYGEVAIAAITQKRVSILDMLRKAEREEKNGDNIRPETEPGGPVS